MPHATHHEHPPVPFGLLPTGRSLPHELLRARELMLRRFRPLFHASDITEQQWRVLRVIVEHGACSMQTLAEACCIHPPSLSRMIPKLLLRGLVQRRSDLRDQRRAEITITAEGRAFYTSLKHSVVEVYAQMHAELGRDRFDHALQVIAELIEALGGAAAFLTDPDPSPEEGDSGDAAA